MVQIVLGVKDALQGLVYIWTEEPHRVSDSSRTPGPTRQSTTVLPGVFGRADRIHTLPRGRRGRLHLSMRKTEGETVLQKYEENQDYWFNSGPRGRLIRYVRAALIVWKFSGLSSVV